MKVFRVALMAVGLAACGQTIGQVSTMTDQQAIALAKQRITASLKDPDSARFGEFERRTHQLGIPNDRVCAVVNAKNTFGAYTGMHYVAYRLDNNIVVEGENAGFLCNGN